MTTRDGSTTDAPGAPDTRDAAETAHLRVALIGLGEVGRTYGRALSDAAHDVHGYDPYLTDPVDGVTVAPDLATAVRDADIVLVLTAAAASHTVADQVGPHLKAGAAYVDCTSSAPGSKAELRDRLGGRNDIDVIDVAILGPVISLGVSTPLMAAGHGAERVADLMGPLGAPVTVVDGDPGAAMAHKLLRSVLMKGLAAVVTEAVTAGRAVGYEDWIRGQIARELAGDGQATIDRFLRGSVTHAVRRGEEMQAAAAYLEGLGVDATMSHAAATHLGRLANLSTPAH